MDWIKNLKIKDKVIIHIQYGRYPLIKKIEKITKTLIITEDGSRFSISSGCTPGTGFNKNRMEKWSPEQEIRIKIKQAKINYSQKFKKFNWGSLSIDDLRKVNSIIQESK